jgi:hypothetical protein
MARRLSEKGVRFVQVSHTYKWDQHSDLLRDHAQNARDHQRVFPSLTRSSSVSASTHRCQSKAFGRAELLLRFGNKSFG